MRTTYRRPTIPLIAGLTLICAATGARPAELEPPGHLQAGQAASRLGEILRKVKSSNAPELIGKARWSALVAEHREAIEACTTHETFAAAVNRLITDSGISHFRYYTDDDWAYWHLHGAFGSEGPESEIAHVGIFPQEIDGRWFVRGVLEDSPAEGLDIRVGDELVSVDGMPFEPVRSFRGRAGRPLTLTLRRRPGQEFDVQVVPTMESLHQATQRAVVQSISRIEHEGFTFAYMHGWTLLGQGREYDRLAELQGDVDGLILDYRDGFGGTWMAAERFLVGNPSDDGHPGVPPRWIKPVVILIGDGTRSAKEIVVHRVQRARRAPLVGEPTPGHVTSVGGLKQIGRDGLLMLPGHRFQLEGKPTQPDYPIARKLRYAAGADPQMDFARKLIARMAREQQRVSDQVGSQSNN